MVDHIPSLCLAIDPAETPDVLLRNRTMAYPEDENWSPESDEAEEAVMQLVNAAYEADSLWMFTSTNHWYDSVLCEIGSAQGSSALGFLGSFYSVLMTDELHAAVEALDAVLEQIRRDRMDLGVSENSDVAELLREIPAGDPEEGASVSREVDELEHENPFVSFVLSLRAAIKTAASANQAILWYPTHA